MLRRTLFIVGIIIFLGVGYTARAYYNPGTPTSFVNDYTKTFTSDQTLALNNKLAAFNATTSNEIAVVIIQNLQGDTIDNFAVKLFADWKIGKAKKDNGVLVLVALDDHKMRIETGYGLEGALPDAITNQIITKTMKPAFQQGDYYGGIDQATDEIISATKGEYTADASTSSNSLNMGSFHLSFDVIFWIIIGFFYLMSALWRFLAKSKSWWQGGVIGAGIGLLIAVIFFRTLLLLIILPAIIGAFGLVMDFLVSRVLPQPGPVKKGRNNLWFFGGGGSGFGGGSGGGGFGGFGGGGSGGGGSSGGW